MSTDLGQLLQTIEEHQVSNPSMIIVGEVVSERQTPDWFERKPLFGKKILLVDTERISFEVLVDYTVQGADVYGIQVGEQRDRRFDEVDAQYLADH